MAKDDRSAINPFTNKKHLDLIDDDKFLNQCYSEYNRQINSFQLLDDTDQGKLVRKIANDLINAVENFLLKIGRYDYVEDYYDWEFHLVANSTVNAWCMPGGKIVMYSGMLGPANTVDDLALVLAHEMAHALLDHSRTQQSARNAKNAITTAAWVGSIGLSLFGMGELGALTRTAANVADIGSEYFLLMPFGREHEFEADKLGMMIMHWAGYDISGAPTFWSRVSQGNPNEMDFFSTHPADSKRIENMKQLINEINNGKDFYNAPVLGSGNNAATASATVENKNRCPSCGKILDADNIFCTNCGTRIQENTSKMLCPNCHKSIDADSAFCIHCGEKLSKDDKTVDGDRVFPTVLNSMASEKNEFVLSKEDNSNELICSSCGEPIKEGNLFCVNCGASVSSDDEDSMDDVVSEENVVGGSEDDVSEGDIVVSEENVVGGSEDDELICSSCGEPIKEGNLFCVNCGASVSLDDESSINGDVLEDSIGESEDENIISKDSTEEKSSELVCPNCGKSIKEGNSFCIHCGASLSVNDESVDGSKIVKESKEEEKDEEFVCPSCGKSIKEGNSFCIHCGASLSSNDESSVKKEKKENRINIFDYFEDKNEKERLNKPDFVKCLNCGTNVGSNNKFCPECGADLSGIIICSNCGESNGIDDNFCINCGSPLNDSKDDFKICKNCGKKLDASYSFCIHCGHKI